MAAQRTERQKIMTSYIEEGINTVILDMAQVVLKYDWESYLHSFGYSQEVYETIADAVFRNEDWETGDVGNVTPDEWVELLVENAPEYKKEIMDVLSGMEAVISPMEYARQWIMYFKDRGLKVYYLSNYSELLYNKTKHLMDFIDLFDGGFFSYQVKCMKPFPEIYKLLLERYRIRPEEAVFFDDRENNAEAARKLGIKSVVFTPDIAYKMLGSV